MGEVEWSIREYREGDEKEIAELINASDDADGLMARANEEDLREQFNSPGVQAIRQVVVAEGQGKASGTVVGYGRAFPSGSEENRVYNIAMRVHPAARNRGLEREIAGQLVDIALRGLDSRDRSVVGRVRLRSYVYEKHTSVRQAWSELGLRIVRRSSTMIRDLGPTIDDPREVTGVHFRTYRHPEDNAASLAALNRAMADYFDAPPIELERWNAEMQQPAVRHDLSWLAEAEGDAREIAGYALCMVGENENSLQGRLDGWIEGFGTVPEWRNRGIGRSLLLRALRSLKEAGMTAALVDVDSEGPSAATHLLESLGFVVRDTMYQYECLLREVTI